MKNLLPVKAGFYITIITAMLFSSQMLQAASDCGDVWHTERVGPYDYADPINFTSESLVGSQFASRIDMVETYHFPLSVERLESARKGTIGMSIDYTLMVFPNHYRALWAAIRYEKKLKGNYPQIQFNDFAESAECYLIRATTFRPEDPKVRQLYGSYYHMNKEYDKALEQYKLAEAYKGDTGELAYNMGLVYYDMEDYDKAKSYAEKAIELKYPLKGLKKKLTRKKKW